MSRTGNSFAVAVRFLPRPDGSISCEAKGHPSTVIDDERVTEERDKSNRFRLSGTTPGRLPLASALRTRVFTDRRYKNLTLAGRGGARLSCTRERDSPFRDSRDTCVERKINR